MSRTDLQRGQQTARKVAHFGRTNSYLLRPRRITLIKTKQEGMKSGRSGALKPDRLDMSCKVNKCRDAGAGDTDVLPTRETSPYLGECRRKCK